MKIIKAENSGFCFGVEKAIETALSTEGTEVYSLGELIHNESVTKKLESKGIRIIGENDCPKTGKVIIRSHGIGKQLYERLSSSGAEIVDATCPFVKKIHNIVARHYESGYHICIIGESTHPEVIGINGWCGFSADIIGPDFDFEILKAYEKVCIVSQTTFSIRKYSEIVKKIENLGLKTVEIFDTICYTTFRRQSEAEELAKKCSLCLVLGSRKSSNTIKLFEICKSNCDRSYQIESREELKKIKFFPDDNVGLLAGASTPEELIMEVYNYMSQNFEEVLNQEFISGVEESLVNYKEGKRVKGVVILADDKGIRVNIGGKKDGLILKEETSIDGQYNPDDYKPDMELEAIITSKNDSESGCVLLSKKKVDLIKEGDKVVDTIRGGEDFELTADKETKGGLLGKLGTYSVFIPASQVKERYVKDLKPFLGKKLRLTALEIDDAKHKIVASQKKVLERERKEKEETFWTHVQPNVVVTGVVKRITNFGAFVSVAGFDCLAHIVDISWNHIKNIEDVLKIGQTYDFLVLSADREKNRVSLGYKQLQPHPFDAAMQKYPIGSVLTGKVVNVVNYGAFVEIEKGVEGLVHVSETAHNFVKDINEVVKPGDTVEVKVINIDRPSKKITLSMKACLPEEPQEQREEQRERSDDKRPAKARKPGFERKPRADEDLQKEWNEEASNNPFADLLKDLDLS